MFCVSCVNPQKPTKKNNQINRNVIEKNRGKTYRFSDEEFLQFN